MSRIVVAYLVALVLLNAQTSCFEIADKIKASWSMSRWTPLKVYASDLFSDPVNRQLSQVGRFHEFTRLDPTKLMGLENEPPTFLQKLSRDNYQNTSYLARQGLTADAPRSQ